MVFGLFSKERALKRTIEKATNKLAQHVDRWAAMEKLRDNGSDEALYALLQRFSFAYDKSVEDEQEKQWVVDTLTAKGPAALGPLRRYMKNALSIAYPLEILGRIADHDKVLEVIDELIEAEAPGYSRDPAKKQQMLDWLAEWQAGTDEEVAQRAALYLTDFDEGVRFAATEALAQRPHPCAAEALATALVRPEEESLRLKLRMAEVLADNELDLGERKAEISEMLKGDLESFHLKHDKLHKR